MSQSTPLSEFARRRLPKDNPRRILFAAYVLMVIWGAIATAGGSGLSIVLLCAGLVGVLGNNRPWAVVLAWSPFFAIGLMALLVIGQDPANGPIAIILLGIGGGALFLAFKPQSQARQAVLIRNQRDFSRRPELEQELAELAAAPPLTDSNSEGVEVIRAARLGEVNRHFDSQLAGEVNGWLNHDLRIRPNGLFLLFPMWSLARGRVKIQGTSQVNLDTNSTQRDNLLGDGFVAVVETSSDTGVPETTRVIVPSYDACRDQIAAFLDGMSEQLGPGSYLQQTLLQSRDTLLTAVRTDTTYVSDQLAAVARMPIEQRPTMMVIGSPLGEHALMGAAIQIGAGKLLQLYPIAYVRALAAAIEPALAEILEGQPAPSPLPAAPI